MIIKCKMCGGDIIFNPGDTYGRCDSCDSVSTIPQADDENKLNRYNRANHFRRQCEFDKAVAAYEKLLEQDDTDAEAHWGAVISRYGIEYVEDPATHKRIPTCHRVQLTSILADADYLAAVEHAPDNFSRDLYTSQAMEIAEIQKGILAVSANEKPYDVFICYKETDENGQRTRDSALAQDVYYGLTEQGYKVFFSRITLEDKLGQQYEPYIFAALNSAKVMVVIGTKAEYFNAVWVKNEWSRYLAIMAKDRKRLLIPCYRGMDPYDLPDELSALQSQDMSKIGFMQDLLRGISKVLDAEKKSQQPQVIERVVQVAPAADGATPGTASLLRRAFMFLEDGDWHSADEYCEKVLDIDPENAEAYLGKLMAELQVRTRNALKNHPQPFDRNVNCQKVLRFGDASLKAEITDCNKYIKEQNEIARMDGIYTNASRIASKAVTEEQFIQAKNLFESIAHYKDATAMAMKCATKAAAERQRCDQEAKKARLEAERKVQKKKKSIAIITIVAITCIALFVLTTQVIIPSINYNNAVALRDEGRYADAATAFSELGNFSDAKEQILATFYAQGAELLAANAYDDAYVAFQKAGQYSDAPTQCKEALYQKAQDMIEAKNYYNAYAVLVTIKGYKDTNQLLATDSNLINARYMHFTKIGNIVQYGQYEWIVLSYTSETNTVKLLCRYGVKSGDLNHKGNVDSYASYNSSNTRTWLNNDFFHSAFDVEERKAIIPLEPGNANSDKVFLLSAKEVEQYLPDPKTRVTKCLTGGISSYWMDSEGNCYWWLNSKGKYDNQAVTTSGYVRDMSCGTDLAIRPVINLRLDLFSY